MNILHSHQEITNMFSKIVSYKITMSLDMRNIKNNEGICYKLPFFNQTTIRRKQAYTLFKELITLSESPFRIMEVILTSWAKSGVLITAKASILSTVVGRETLSDMDAITSPKSTRIITPILASPASLRQPHRNWHWREDVEEVTILLLVVNG